MDLFERILFLFFILFKISCKRFKSIMTILSLHYLFLLYFIKFIKILFEIWNRYTSTGGVGYFTLFLILIPVNLHITKVITYIHFPLPLRFNLGLGEGGGVKLPRLNLGICMIYLFIFLGFMIFCLSIVYIWGLLELAFQFTYSIIIKIFLRLCFLISLEV